MAHDGFNYKDLSKLTLILWAAILFPGHLNIVLFRRVRAEIEISQVPDNKTMSAITN